MTQNTEQIVASLKSRFPYQFERSEFGASVTTGWLPRFVELCEEVDAALGEDKRGFHWSGCGEKFGVARFGFDFHARKNVAIETRALLNPVVGKAMSDLKCSCAVCGAPGEIDNKASYLMTLCTEHRGDRGGDFWVVIDMGENYKRIVALNMESNDAQQ